LHLFLYSLPIYKDTLTTHKFADIYPNRPNYNRKQNCKVPKETNKLSISASQKSTSLISASVSCQQLPLLISSKTSLKVSRLGL
jgi:hypothetical protein